MQTTVILDCRSTCGVVDAMLFGRGELKGFELIYFTTPPSPQPHFSRVIL
uniref:Uncharacterized protein n=1 Tax=Rhizophora mucronata TaxID=61149 RepID=A0A2P2NH95_RHIMU